MRALSTALAVLVALLLSAAPSASAKVRQAGGLDPSNTQRPNLDGRRYDDIAAVAARYDDRTGTLDISARFYGTPSGPAADREFPPLVFSLGETCDDDPLPLTGRSGVSPRGRRAELRRPRLACAAGPPFSTGACSCGRPDCPKPGKHPRGRRGLTDATTRAAQITAWWGAWPDANVGVATGRLVVLDVDGDHGRASLAELERTHAPLPLTLMATTGRGAHFYFDAGARRIPNSAGRLGAGLDVRGHGGYIVVPPSQHADGRRYHWNSRRAPTPLPCWLADLLAPPERAPIPPGLLTLTRPAARGRRARYFAAALRAELGDVATAQPGTRNDTLNRAAFRLAQLAASGHGDIGALPELLLHAAVAAGLSETEALAKITSGLQAGQKHPRPTPLAR